MNATEHSVIRIYLIDSHPAKGSERTGSSALTVNQHGEPWALLAENLKLSKDELDSMNRGGGQIATGQNWRRMEWA
jgi:GH43 family beta-xylosidase